MSARRAPSSLPARDTSEDFLEPTRESRRNLALIWTLLAAVGALIVWWLKPALLSYVMALPACEQLPWLRAFVVAALVSPLAIAAWAANHARKVLRCGQLPLPGTWVFQRTPILRGRRAQLRAYLLLVAAVGAVAIPALGWPSIRQTPLFVTPSSCLLEP